METTGASGRPWAAVNGAVAMPAAHKAGARLDFDLDEIFSADIRVGATSIRVQPFRQEEIW